jgi:hypothetical protein
MTKKFLEIFYSGFYDAPLAFFVNYKGTFYLFWRGYFDEELDDYPSEYEVFSVKDLSIQEVKNNWDILWEKERIFVGKIHMNDVIFSDQMKRNAIDEATFESLFNK